MAPAPSIPKAAFWMALSITSMLGMSIAGRETTAELNVFQVLELRSVIGFFILLPLVMMNGGFAAMRTQRPFAHITRNVIHYTGQAAWLYALTLIPLAVLISIEFTTPIWTAILAVSFLGERLSRSKLTAIAAGRFLAGVGLPVASAGDSIRPAAASAATNLAVVDPRTINKANNSLSESI